MNEKRSVTFIVPVYNTEETVVETLDSIAALRTGAPIEIVAVDDGSSDRSVEIVQHWIETESANHERIQSVLLQTQHGGEAAAMNAGLERASAPVVAWVESDVKLDPDWLNHLLNEISKENVVGAGGLLLPAEDDSAVARIFGYEIAYKIQSNTANARHITSANALYRKAVFDELGPCRDELGASSFDSEYNQRVRNAGYILRCNPSARAWHHFKGSLWQCLKRTGWYGYRRPFVSSQVLYPFDRWVGMLVLLSSLAFPALALLFVWPWLAGAVLAGVLLANVGYGLFLYSRFQDVALLLSPAVVRFSNWTFFAAYLMGWAKKLTGGKG